MKRILRSGVFALALLAVPGSAFAETKLDTKQGVEAWSRGDYANAIKIWRPLAIAGDDDAQFNMGQAYKLGRGVPVDLKIAEDWYRKAAEQGHLQASDNYGLVLFTNGDRQKAMPYLKTSAERGEPRAQYIYGTALFNGEFVAKDLVLAYAMMTRASSSGLAPASASLAQMDRFIPVAERQKGQLLARDLEQSALRQPIPEPAAISRPTSRPPASTIRNEPLPPSTPVVTRPVVRPPVVAVRPIPKPTPQPAVATGKGWRVQLGAFGDPSKARALYQSLEGRVSALGAMQPFLVKAGAVTRLQAGPLVSKAAAEKLCAAVKAAGQGCLVVAP
jgi:uncharacterized protein